ncbi:MAG: NlpC/P60 family protein [Streptococcus sp.]
MLFSSNGSTSGIHHVGIYIGGGNMVHAPQTGKPVQVADLVIHIGKKNGMTFVDCINTIR